MTRTTLDKIASGATIGEKFVNEVTGKTRIVRVYNESDFCKFPHWIDVAHNINPESLGESAKIEIMAHQMNNGQI